MLQSDLLVNGLEGLGVWGRGVGGGSGGGGELQLPPREFQKKGHKSRQ